MQVDIVPDNETNTHDHFVVESTTLVSDRTESNDKFLFEAGLCTSLFFKRYLRNRFQNAVFIISIIYLAF